MRPTGSDCLQDDPSPGSQRIQDEKTLASPKERRVMLVPTQSEPASECRIHLAKSLVLRQIANAPLMKASPA
jgi:hypothetical protein